MTDNPHGMTDQQWAFCRKYVEQGFKNATGAYQYAYPRSKSLTASAVNASRQMTRPNVAAYLAEVKLKAQENTQITADRVLAELGKIGFSNMQDYVAWGPEGVTLKDSADLTPAMRAAVSEVTETVGDKGGSIKFKLHAKREALEAIGKHFGMFTDKRAGEFGGEPSEEMTPERAAELFERVQRITTVEDMERMLVAAAKKQAEEK